VQKADVSFAVVVGKVNEQPASGRHGILALPDEGKASSNTESPAASEQRLGATINQVGGVENALKLLMVDSGR
jgi:hypothetical protein